MTAAALATATTPPRPITAEVRVVEESFDWDAEVERVARFILASRAEYLADIEEPRRRLGEIRERQHAELVKLRELARARRGQLPLNELREGLVARAVELDQQREDQAQARREEEAAEPFIPGTRSEPAPRTPDEIPLATVRAALERGYRLIASVGREASPMGGMIETLELGVLEDIEQAMLRRSLAHDRVAIEREAWAAFLAHRLTAEERQLLGMVVRGGRPVAIAASAMRLSQRTAERRLTMAYAKVRVFIFDSDGE